MTGDLPWPVLDLQLTGDHSVGKASAIGQLTRQTQPFIISGSIKVALRHMPLRANGGAVWGTLTR